MLAVVPLLLSLVGGGLSLNLPFRRDTSLRRRSSVDVSPSANWSNLNFQNFADNRYTVTLYANGEPFQVQLDTGSSDLWLDPVVAGVTIEGLFETGFNTSIQYVDTTEASGPIKLGNVSVGEFEVQNQAFIFSPGNNVSIPDIFDGLLGVAAPTASSVKRTLNGSAFDGSHFLERVFRQQPSEDPIITFLLSRSSLGFSDGGFFSIGEVNPNYTDITSAPKLDVLAEIAWLAAMDGVIVNGQFHNGNGISPLDAELGILSTQTTIILDTGTSAGQAPPYYVDAMYAHVPGAVFDGVSTYTVPCDTKINISMVFGENVYPMAPIDAIEVGIDENNNITCTGAFSYTSASAGIDFILGDSFMRNVYSLFNFGNWTDVGSGPAYMQILGITDPEEAWLEFDTILANFIAAWQAAITTDSLPENPLSSLFPQDSSTSSATATWRSASSTSGPWTSTSWTSPSWTSASASTPAPHVGGAIDVASSSPSSSVDLSPLTRNTWIIIGMLGAVLALLLAIFVRLIVAGRKGRQYTPVPVHVGPPSGHSFQDVKPEETYSESYSTPYDDGGR